MNSNLVAVFSTVYPEGTQYLSDWYKSILAQTDGNFDIWIGCDRISVSDAVKGMGGTLTATWILKEENESAIHLRERMVREIVKDYSMVIFVDSDDILMPTRVEAAKEALQSNDFYGCSMTLIDECGANLNRHFHPPEYYDVFDLMVRTNIYGLSNTAYRTDVLEKCLPFPENCILLDWFIATKALNNSAVPYFDEQVRMLYRQHSLNTARVLPPFSCEQILLSTKRVLDHYSCVLAYIPNLSLKFKEKIILAQAEVEEFNIRILESEELLQLYVNELNELSIDHIWWSCLANPQLEEIWRN
ncbi:hypothetical protein FTO68_11220 [Methanocalculus taiwanensis]|uniref:Glycosyltransferase 2-like domain-containing protein n=1 Tax=Methanocalculus taiwanensis TaxID=106207 RepID=A0ABD4TKV7_9EURY|nr:hypothetical protein [Methanocalculus taiwanensis]MCQ1539547.1 hypothetical protein [Methanocalculus taiwanensis]